MGESVKKVLLVDDDRLILSVINQVLVSAGYEVFLAENGKEAIELGTKNAPDLAILDMSMPSMDGIAVAKWFRESSSIPFIFLSAYSDEDLVAQAVDEGALGYLVKPVDPPQLLAAVRAALVRSLEIHHLKDTSDQLNQALAGDRTISTAVGILVYRDRLTEEKAFQKLRQYARSNNRKLSDVAEELVSATESVNKIN
ncbi:MAG: response regulator [Gammaproteobacteria bacterium]|nr:response regulator [Gammaproteobacteria bacterium]